MNEQNTYQELSKPFDPDVVQWKPGATTRDKTRAMGLPYVDSRDYMKRLDAVTADWTDRYEVVSLPDRVAVVCHLTVDGVTRSGDGECPYVDGRGEVESNSVTSASAQAFKRACTKFGIGRYLYDFPKVWVDYDAQRRWFTQAGLNELQAQLHSWSGNGDGNGHRPARQPSAAPRSNAAASPSPTGNEDGNGNGSTTHGNGNGNGDAGSVVVKFGKYEGQTLRQIAGADLDYLDWLAREWRWEKGRQAAAAVLAHYRQQESTSVAAPF